MSRESALTFLLHHLRLLLPPTRVDSRYDIVGSAEAVTSPLLGGLHPPGLAPWNTNSQDDPIPNGGCSSPTREEHDSGKVPSPNDQWFPTDHDLRLASHATLHMMHGWESELAGVGAFLQLKIKNKTQLFISFS